MPEVHHIMNVLADSGEGGGHPPMPDPGVILNPEWVTGGIYFPYGNSVVMKHHWKHFDIWWSWKKGSVFGHDTNDYAGYKWNNELWTGDEQKFRDSLANLTKLVDNKGTGGSHSENWDPGATFRIARELNDLGNFLSEKSEELRKEYNSLDLPGHAFQGSAGGAFGARIYDMFKRLEHMSDQLDDMDQVINKMNSSIEPERSELSAQLHAWLGDENTRISKIIENWYNTTTGTEQWNPDRKQFHIVYNNGNLFQKDGFQKFNEEMPGIVGDGITDRNINAILKNLWRERFSGVNDAANAFFNKLEKVLGDTKNAVSPGFREPLGGVPPSAFSGKEGPGGEDDGNPFPDDMFDGVFDNVFPKDMFDGVFDNVFPKDMFDGMFDDPPSGPGTEPGSNQMPDPNLGGGPDTTPPPPSFPDPNLGGGPNTTPPPPSFPDPNLGGPGTEPGSNQMPTPDLGGGPDTTPPPPLFPHPGGPGTVGGLGGNDGRNRRLETDPVSGLPINPDTGQPFPVDPETNQPFDPETGLPIATDPQTDEVLPIDPLTGEPYEPGTESPTLETDPITDLPLNPETGEPFPVDSETGLPYSPETGLPIITDPETDEVLPIDPLTGLPEGYDPGTPDFPEAPNTESIPEPNFPEAPNTESIPESPPENERSILDPEPINYPPSSGGDEPGTSDRSSMFSGPGGGGQNLTGMPTGPGSVNAPAASTNGMAPGGAGQGSETGSQSGGGPGMGGMGGRGNGMMPPMMPPGMGGMGGMGGGQGQGNERQRSTWLSEDERVWGTAATRDNVVLGRRSPGDEKRSTRNEFLDPGGDRTRTGSFAEDAPRSGGRKRKPGVGNRRGHGKEQAGDSDSERER